MIESAHNQRYESYRNRGKHRYISFKNDYTLFVNHNRSANGCATYFFDAMSIRSNRSSSLSSFRCHYSLCCFHYCAAPPVMELSSSSSSKPKSAICCCTLLRLPSHQSRHVEEHVRLYQYQFLQILSYRNSGSE